MRDFRLRTVAARADSPTRRWPRWAPLFVWIIACAVLSAALVHLSPLVYGWQTRDELVQLFRAAPMLAIAALFAVFRDPNQRPFLALASRPSWRVLLATGIALLTGAVVVVTTLAARDTFLGTRTALPALGVPLLIALTAAVVTALCEEVAWRSWLQPELEQWWGPLLSAVAVGFVWGLWYALIRRPDVDHALSFGMTAMAFSVAIRAILHLAPGNNLIVGTAAHAALNVGLLTVLPGRGEDPGTMWSLVVASWMVATALWLVTRFRPVRAWAMPVDTSDLIALTDDELSEAELAEAGLVEAGLADVELTDDELSDAEQAAAANAAAEPDDSWHWISPAEPDEQLEPDEPLGPDEQVEPDERFESDERWGPDERK